MTGNAAWATVGSTATAAGQWLILVLLAKLGSPTLLGRFSLGLAVTTPILMFANLQLRGLQAVDASRRHCFGDYLALRIATTSIAMTAIVGLGLASRQSANVSLLIVAVGCWKGMEGLGEIVQGLFQQRERMDLVACSQVLRVMLVLVAMGSMLLLTGDVLLSVWCMAGAGSLALVCFDFPAAALLLGRGECAELWPRWDARELVRLARRALPLGVAMMLSSLIVNIPRYAISRAHGDAALGAYTAVSSLLAISILPVTAMGQSASPRLAQFSMRGRRDEFHRLVLRLMVIAGGLGAVGLVTSWLIGRWLLSVLFDASYAGYVPAFRVVMLASAVASVATPLGFALTAGGHHAVQIPLLLVVATGSACGSWFLVPRHGPIGGAWSLAVGYLLLLGGSLAILAVAEARRRRLG